MRYTITFGEDHFRELTTHLFADRTTEQAAYLLCSLSSTGSEERLLVRQFIPVMARELEEASDRHLVIPQTSFLPAIKKAAIGNLCFVFVHSHPDGYPSHSPQDDKEEPKLFRTAYNRIHRAKAVHASLVFSSPEKPVGRVWLETGETAEIDRVRVIGKRFLFYDSSTDHVDLSAFNRQVLAFGAEVQDLLKRLTVGVVGLGGTGSAVTEQLIRLGVGCLVVCDPQNFEKSNVNRVYGSGLSDEGRPKTEIAEELALDIGLATEVKPHQGSITDLHVAKAFRDCDVIFGCTDDEWGRAVLSKMALSYLIPVFDTGVMVDSENGVIKSVRGRITTLIPQSPCLFCRGAISGDTIAAEIKYKFNPEEYESLKREGYARELPGNAPSVIMFTSTVGSMAVSELLHRITGFMGDDRVSTELLVRFDESKISRSTRISREGCWCADPTKWGMGDVEPFLGMTWTNESR
jgi:molybdopterin/thiamine biosynthesis adenylyltransferase